MKTIFGVMLAFALCLMWIPSVSAGNESGVKIELQTNQKHVILMNTTSEAKSLLAFDVVEVQTDSELQINCVSAVLKHIELSPLPYIVMEKCRVRFSQGRNLSLLVNSNAEYRFRLMPYLAHINDASRSIPLRC